MFRSTTLAVPVSARAVGASGLVRIVAAMFAAIWTWSFRIRSRRCLAQLDERLIRDIGLDPIDWRREINKPFWRG